MTSPLALTALLLWIALLVLAVRQCRSWAKASRKEKVIEKNHPAIPVKKYDLSEIDATLKPLRNPVKIPVHPKVSAQEQARRLASLQKAWSASHWDT